MLGEPQLFDQLEEEKRVAEIEEFGQSFKFLAPDFAIENRSGRYPKPPVYNDRFQGFLDSLADVRRDLGYERIDQSEAFAQLLEIEKQFGFLGTFSRDAEGIKAGQELYTELRKEYGRLGFRPDYSQCYDGGDHSSARSQFYQDIDKLLAPAREALAVQPIVPTKIQFEEVFESVIKAAASSTGADKATRREFVEAAKNSKALVEAFSGLVSKIEPALAKQDVLIVGTPSSAMNKDI